MGKKILVIGYGSIGTKHCEVLKKLKEVKEIKVVSRRSTLPFKRIELNKKNIKNYNPDYVIICNETYKHYKTLFLINSILKKKIILVEKPIFSEFRKIKLRNKVFVNYLLRTHPLVDKVKSIIESKGYNFANIICYSNVKKWRSNINFSKSYSSSKKKGGGVLRDLSHELDIMYYLFEPKKILYKLNEKISNLPGDADDMALIIAKNNNKKIIMVSINYFSTLNYRKILITGKNYSLSLDLKKNILFYKNKKFKKIIRENLKKNELLKKTHINILNSRSTKKICDFKDSLKIVKNFYV